MLNLIQSAFQKTHSRYCKILNNYYPAHKSAGFTERNLTGNFVYCLEQLLGENAISWFEAPINLKTKEHIDAVVFDLERKHSILIEAKRFSFFISFCYKHCGLTGLEENGNNCVLNYL